MTDRLDEMHDDDAGLESLSWIRKRDGSVVAFDTGKLASSIYAAFEQAEVEDAAFRAQELSQAVMHFLVDTFAGQIPTSGEVAETVTKVLREFGQGPAAAAYHDFGTRRQNLRHDISIEPPRSQDSGSVAGNRYAPEDLDRLASWDKSKVAWALQEELDLDPVTARDISTSVERRLMTLQLERISSGLIRELINCELLERGLRRLLERRRLLNFPSARLNELLGARGSYARLHHRLGGEILEQYALQEVFSRDVAGLHFEGLLHLFDLTSPCQWPALSANVPALAMRSADESGMLDNLEEHLHEQASRAAGVIAIEALDSVLALASSDDADPIRLADKVYSILARVLSVHPIRMVVNLFGRVPEFVAQWLSDGPLFQIRASEAQQRLAGSIGEALAQRIVVERSMHGRCRLDLHIEPDGQTYSLDHPEPWSRWILSGGSVCLCFDRRGQELAEGLFWDDHGRSAVCQYVGIDLMELHRHVGSVNDDDNLTQRLAMLCETAVRAGVQKREFLRRLQPELFAGHRPYRAQMVVVPIGLDRLVTQMLGSGLNESAAARDFALQLLRTIKQRLAREGKHYQLPCEIAGYPVIAFPEPVSLGSPAGDDGSMTYFGSMKLADQLKATGTLNGLTSGTAVYRLSEPDANPETIIDLVAQAWQDKHIRRLRFQRPVAAHQRELFEALA